MENRDPEAAPPLPAPNPVADGEPAEDVSAPQARPQAPLGAPLLSAPTVVLTDPPAIFGGASHTW